MVVAAAQRAGQRWIVTFPAIPGLCVQVEHSADLRARAASAVAGACGIEDVSQVEAEIDLEIDARHPAVHQPGG